MYSRWVARPLSALSILCYPEKGDIDVLREILRGGEDKMREADCVILGGHSVSDDEIKFGYAVTGTVHPDRVFTNAGAKAGDVLVLTKRLGTGVISTALKRGIASQGACVRRHRIHADAEPGAPAVAHGCTDVTGFGLLGHAREMALASGITIEIDSRRVPLLPGAVEYARAGAVPGGTRNNREFVASCVEMERQLPAEIDALLYDPQTSGGLLIATSDPEPGAP